MFTAEISCTVLYMDDDELMQQITDSVGHRAKYLHQVEIATDSLKQDIPEAIRRGLLTEVAAHKLVGVSRTTIREWRRT